MRHFQMMEFDAVCDPPSFSEYVTLLRGELSGSGENWENIDLDSFLEAMARWARDRTEPANSNPWRHAAELLAASTIYE